MISATLAFIKSRLFATMELNKYLLLKKNSILSWTFGIFQNVLQKSPP